MANTEVKKLVPVVLIGTVVIVGFAVLVRIFAKEHG